MSFETIKIYHSWPIINGFAQLPNNLPSDKTRVTTSEAITYAGGEEVYLSLGSGDNTGSKFGAQKFIRLPARDTNGFDYATGNIASDPVEDVIGY